MKIVVTFDVNHLGFWFATVNGKTLTSAHKHGPEALAELRYRIFKAAGEWSDQ